MSTATIERDEGVARAHRHAPRQWISDAGACLRALAITQTHFTADDVWQVIGQPPEPRALGGVMVDMASNGWIKPTPRFEPSVRPERHAGPVRVWKCDQPPKHANVSIDHHLAVLDELRARYRTGEAP